MMLISVVLIIKSGLFSALHAQIQVTFRTNIEHLTEEIPYNPETDKVELIVYTYPFSSSQPLHMKRKNADTHIFERTVEFPQRMAGNRIQFRYRLTHNGQTILEDMVRNILIRHENQTDILYFNSYAW